MIDAALITESRMLLNQARMIAEASAAQPGQIGRTHPSSRVPAGAFTSATSTLDQCSGRIEAAILFGEDEPLRAANRWCARELRALQHGPVAVAVETRGQFHARIVREYEGVKAAAVAARERSSVTEVRRARQLHGRTGRFGHRIGSP